ncbi:MAG: excalibur calcium-binding domain-containing protein [Saccharothrix sp.]|nr:excalibur calcium-binding domain-containing protein [Saccharothrix sp.]
MSNLSAGVGRSIDYGEWSAEAFPTPRVVRRVVNDHFYKWDNNPTIYYQGPAFERAISYQEWVGAGSPSPEIRRSGSTPGYPGNSVDCSDFATQREAQSWFDYYYPYYGDVALLDADHDGIACEALP